MHGLIEELGRNASSNLQNIAGALTAIVSDLTRKVEEVSETMIRSAGNVAAESQSATDSLIAKTGVWTETTNQRLARSNARKSPTV